MSTAYAVIFEAFLSALQMGLGPGHGFLIALVSALLPLTFAQNGADQAALAANMKKFAEGRFR